MNPVAPVMNNRMMLPNARSARSRCCVPGRTRTKFPSCFRTESQTATPGTGFVRLSHARTAIDNRCLDRHPEATLSASVRPRCPVHPFSGRPRRRLSWRRRLSGWTSVAPVQPVRDGELTPPTGRRGHALSLAHLAQPARHCSMTPAIRRKSLERRAGYVPTKRHVAMMLSAPARSETVRKG